MSRDHREWTDRFSEYLEGELGEADADAVEAHLAECGACREVLAGLRAVVSRAGALGELTPPRDLWPGIASTIEGAKRARDPAVIELPTARAGRGPAGRAAMGPARLAVAAAALVAVSVGLTWWAATSTTGAVTGLADGIVAGDPGAALQAVEGASPPPDLAGELAALEQVLEAARGSLDPNTVRVLERNLGVIEQAIADSRDALAVDPGNAFLTEHLERMYRRKLVYLQDVVRVVQWSG